MTAWGATPRFLLHDNDGIFGRFRERQRRGHKGLRYRCQLDVWLADAMGTEGITIPYGAPSANPHVERFHRTLRQEALDHFIFVSERHVLRVCRELVLYYILDVCLRQTLTSLTGTRHKVAEPMPRVRCVSDPSGAAGGVRQGGC
jgi:hypothetical protein